MQIDRCWRWVSALLVTASLSACHEVDTVAPDPADPGQTITIEGRGFGASPTGSDAVLYGGASLAIVSWQDDRIRVIAPEVPEASYALWVRAGGHRSQIVSHTIAGPLAILSPELEPNPRNHLSATLRFQTSRPAAVQVEIIDAETTRVVPASGVFTEGTHHEVWLLELVVGDGIVELTRDGNVVQSISLFDFLDPYRFTAWEFHAGFWNSQYGGTTKDWTHANGVQFDPSDDSVIVSMRHQNMVVKIGGAPPRLLWAIGEDDPATSGDDDYPWLELEGPGRAPSYQHAPALLANGNVMIYDNRNDRPELGSRVVEYAIDDDAGTFTEAWSWLDPEHDPPLSVPLTGDADPLPGGTVLVADTAVGDISGRRIRLTEVRKADGMKVWEMWIADDSGQWSFLGFDAERIDSLYPNDER